MVSGNSPRRSRWGACSGRTCSQLVTRVSCWCMNMRRPRDRKLIGSSPVGQKGYHCWSTCVLLSPPFDHIHTLSPYPNNWSHISYAILWSPKSFYKWMKVSTGQWIWYLRESDSDLKILGGANLVEKWREVISIEAMGLGLGWPAWLLVLSRFGVLF